MQLWLVLAGIGILLVAGISDLRLRLIPNRLSVALIGLGLLRIADLLLIHNMSGGGGALLDLGVSAALFGGGVGFFALGWLGGGDVKLLAASGLWLGHAEVPALLMTMALAGGGLSLLFLVQMLVDQRKEKSGGARPRLPYGVAIAMGGIAAGAGLV